MRWTVTPKRFRQLVEQVNRELLNNRNGVDLEISARENALAQAERAVNNLLYAVSRAAQMELPELTEQLMEAGKKKARLESELALLQQRAAQERLVFSEALIAAKVEQMRTDLAAFTHGDVKPVREFLKSLISKAGRSGDGRNEAMAAKNFDRALMFLDRQRKQGLMLLKAIAEKFEGTYHGDLAKTLSEKLK